ncbi:MAG: phosphate signaling complex protein PhoU [Oscillospiraceae bacterium]|nr:phosphate signaling complex protein PhoU [Oscillospiraceae bacterium]
MARSRFDEQLAQMQSSLIRMGALIETAIAKAVKALMTQDAELAKSAIDADDEIDDMEKQVESMCLKLILHQQPIARDLRQISTALKMITDMERIGDHAQDISEITLLLADAVYIKTADTIPQMAAETIKMVSDAIDAYVGLDREKAQAVIRHDDVVDALFTTTRGELLDLIRADPANGEQAMDFLMIAKYFERIGDHAVNIAEWVVFAITGEHKSTRII